MNRTLRLLTVPSVALALALAATAQPGSQPETPTAGGAPAAQPTAQPASKGAPQPGGRGNPRPERPEERLIDVDYPGGTIGEFAQLLQATVTPAPNIVVMPEIESARIGKLSLRQITIMSALRAAITASEDSEASRRWDVVADTVSGQNVLYRIGIDYGRYPQPIPPSKVTARSLQVFPIRDWIGSPETILSAIEGAMRMLDDRNPPKISFHQESGLLFVAGSPAHIQMVSGVLEAMEQRANSSKNGMEIGAARRIIEAIGVKEPEAALQTFRDLKSKADQLTQAEVEAAKSKAAWDARAEAFMREMVDLKERAKDQNAQYQKEMEKLRAELSDLTRQLQAYQAENKMLRDQVGAPRPK